MADRSAADDFFGIEYMSSRSRAEEPKDEKVRPLPDSTSARSRHSVALEDIPEKDLDQLSGTEFLDRAFFPQLQHDQVPSEISRSEPEPDFFEKEFFGRVRTSDKIEATSPPIEPAPRWKINDGRMPLRDAQGIENDHRRMDSRRVPSEDSYELHEESGLNNAQRIPRWKAKEDGKPFRNAHSEGSDRDRRVEDSRRTQPEDNYEMHEESGLNKLRAGIIPIWRMSEDEQVNLMIDRLLFKNDDIIAFDKPYGMAYSGASKTAPQLDRLLQKIKALVAPRCERLHLVRSLDKYESGIVLFATNAGVQSELKECFANGMVEQIRRCIIRGELNDSPLLINIPLIKTVKDRDMKLMPLVSNKAKGEIFYVESKCRTIRGNQYVSSVEVVTRKEVSHQVRAHLALAGCPLIGDSKYSNSSPAPPRLSDHVLRSLEVTNSQSRKIPMYLHLKEVCLPGFARSNAPVRISAPLPDYFKWMLKKLRLLKR